MHCIKTARGNGFEMRVDLCKMIGRCVCSECNVTTTIA